MKIFCPAKRGWSKKVLLLNNNEVIDNLTFPTSASPAARAMNAYFWLLVSHKAQYSGALGVLEGGFSHACEDMLDGLQTHYHIKPDALRFFSGHIEADREHAQTGRKLIDRLLTTDRERQEFLKEVRCAAELYWKGWDAMLQ